IWVFEQAGDGVETKTGGAAIQPEPHGVVHGLAHFGIAPTQVRLLDVEVMVVILTCGGIKLPGGVAKPRLPIVGRLPGALAIAPDVPVALRIRARGTRLLEPGVLVG